MENIIELKDNTEQEDYAIKLVVVGDASVGKSNILSRYVVNEFNPSSHTTIGVELHTKTYKINNKIIKIHIWDTAGQERYKSVTAGYYKGSRGALIVYDITKIESFNNIDKWFNEIREMGEKNVCLMLVGNKKDLTKLRAVDYDKALEKAETLGIPLMETSALESTGINEAFEKLILEIYNTFIKHSETMKDDEEIKHGGAINIDNSIEKKNKSCCK